MTRRAIVVRHRTKDRDVLVARGRNWTKPPKPARRLRIGRESVGLDPRRLLERSLTREARAVVLGDPAAAALVMEALRKTQVGEARRIELVDGCLACRVTPFAWQAPQPVRE